MSRAFTNEELKKQTKNDAMLAFNKADPEILFDFIKLQALLHLKNQRAKLNKLLSEIRSQAKFNGKTKLEACIKEYDDAISDIQKRSFKYTPSKVLQGIGAATVIAGVTFTGFSMGALISIAGPFAAAGISLMGIGSAFDAKWDKSSQNSLMKPIVKAEEKAIRFLKNYKTDPNGTVKNKVNALLPDFKTESKNFKKRLFLFGFGVLCIAAALIALGLVAGSHGVLAPLAFVAHKIAIIGGHHVTAALSGKTNSIKIMAGGLAATGLGSITLGVMFPGKRVAVEDAEKPQAAIISLQK